MAIKKNSRVLIIVIASALVIGMGIFANATNNSFGNLGKKIGQQITNIEKTKDSEIIASINGKAVTKKQFLTYKTLINQNGKEYSDKEILDKMIEHEVLYDEAVKNGLTVSDQEAENTLNSAIELLKKDTDQYSFMKNYIAGLGMTEDKYWKSMIQPYKEDLSIGKYRESLIQRFAKINQNLDLNVLNEKFHKYFDDYKKELISNADIQTNMK